MFEHRKIIDWHSLVPNPIFCLNDFTEMKNQRIAQNHRIPDDQFLQQARY